jgi:hypothetical protein
LPEDHQALFIRDTAEEIDLSGSKPVVTAMGGGRGVRARDDDAALHLLLGCAFPAPGGCGISVAAANITDPESRVMCAATGSCVTTPGPRPTPAGHPGRRGHQPTQWQDPAAPDDRRRRRRAGHRPERAQHPAPRTGESGPRCGRTPRSTRWTARSPARPLCEHREQIIDPVSGGSCTPGASEGSCDGLGMTWTRHGCLPAPTPG